MKTKNFKPRTAASGMRQRLGFDTPAMYRVDGSFQAALSNCADAAPQRSSSAESGSTPRRTKPIRWQDICSGALARAWSFLHAKYKISTTKRLRVSETISLGEKRFVAIVAVEGREFLIGGGVSGMSLLAQLGSVTEAASDLGQQFSNDGGAL
jgi:hypothetical protein